jgi:hypothetical protein
MMQPRDARPGPDPLTVLRPCDATADPSLLTRHMDACVATAVRLGLTAGAALALQGTIVERFAPDLARADQELVRALTAMLGMS